jgi:predicted RNase H-like nuclease
VCAVAGVDGCRGGWVGVLLDGDGDGACRDVRVARTLDSLLETLGAVDVIGVDMPVGLVHDGVRECEMLARALLGARASTVFPMPPRDALAAATHAEAVACCRALGVPGISAQGYALRRKVFEVERFARESRAVPVVEIHPELSFRSLTGDVLPSKRTADGLARREEALARRGLTLPHVRGAGRDDVLDAAAVAWSALRFARGDAVSLPDPPQRGPRGEAIAIWF